MSQNERLSENYLIRAKFSLLENNASQAFSYLKKSLDVDPINYEAWMYLASLHEQNRNIPEAINCSKKSYRLR